MQELHQRLEQSPRQRLLQLLLLMTDPRRRVAAAAALAHVHHVRELLNDGARKTLSSLGGLGFPCDSGSNLVDGLCVGEDGMRRRSASCSFFFAGCLLRFWFERCQDFVGVKEEQKKQVRFVAIA